jgi:hypothetical protein
MKKAMDVSDVLKYAPPGQFHKLFPGGEEYHKGAERWTTYNSFGKHRQSSKLRSVDLDIFYLLK